jgi:hypothetical protein
MWWSIILLRKHVSALALGHHQVSNCVLKETIQNGIYIARNIQRDLVGYYELCKYHTV